VTSVTNPLHVRLGQAFAPAEACAVRVRVVGMRPGDFQIAAGLDAQPHELPALFGAHVEFAAGDVALLRLHHLRQHPQQLAGNRRQARRRRRLDVPHHNRPR
jgi:hypothetical protein